VLKKYFIGSSMNLIKKKYPGYTETELEKIEYGLVGAYLLIPKLIIILIVGHFIGMLSEILIFMIIHMFMKMHTFGLHTKKSWTCFLISLILFIIVPWLALNAEISSVMKCVIGVISICLIYKNCPADTHKRPIINPTKRKIHKILATLTAVIFVILSITLNNSLVANLLLFSLTIQTIFTSPVTYTLLKLPHDNYLRYSN